MLCRCIRSIRSVARNRLLVIVSLLLLLIPPSVAFASTIFTYAQYVNYPDEIFSTTGYASRDFNRVYHAVGYSWNPFYCNTSGSCFGGTVGTSNPTYASGSAGYAKAYCHNINDNSGVLWTCQTTRPS